MTKSFAECNTLAEFEELFPARENLSEGAEVTRIGPSPTGMPHIGTGMQAVLDKALADKNDGIFILRIEDTDQSRTVDGAIDAIKSGLRWLNAYPNEGLDQDGNYGPYLQSERLHIYQVAAKHLVDEGHAYPCFCSTERLNDVRAAQMASNKMPRYDGHCKSLSKAEVNERIDQGADYVIRMKTPENEDIRLNDEVRGWVSFNSDVLDDNVILKTDGFPTYHLASVVDDHFMRITTVVRGEEWISSWPKHELLYRAFGWTPPKFLHTVLLRDHKKRKLSKRSGDVSLTWFRKQGILPEGFRNFLTRVMWAHPEEGRDIYSMEEFTKLLEVTRLPTTGPVVDFQLMQFINGQYISALSAEERANKFLEYLEYLIENDLSAANNILPDAEFIETDAYELKNLYAIAKADFDYTVKIMAIEPERHQRLADIIFNCDYFYDHFYKAPSLEDLNKNLDDLDLRTKLVNCFIEKHDDTMSEDEIEALTKEVMAELGLKPKQIFMTMRLALTGMTRTPPLPEIIHAMGKDRVAKRLLAILDEKLLKTA